MTDIRPFRLETAQADLDDLGARLDRVRWPDEAPGHGWRLGVPLDHLKRLVEYWRTGYDWEAAQAGLNRHDQFVTEIDGQRVHFLHVRSADPGALPLLITHGWPSSPVEYLDVIEPLSRDFHLVIPSLPGYGLSGPTREVGWGSTRIARAWLELMTRLGYERFGVQGGDWGTWISREVGILAPERVAGMHGNGIICFPIGAPGELDGLSEAEQERLAFRESYMTEQYAYKLIQSARPQTFAYGMADSPVALLAWFAGVYHEWSDTEIEPGIDRDRLLTTVMLYWLTNTAGSAARSFTETPDTETDTGVEWELKPATVPTSISVFPKDILRPIRRFAERDNNIVGWVEHERGGTFAALEQPETFTADVRAFFATVR
ncbi:epoxide hydrolase [Nonomuraea longispora]|uniref:Epoxide hydrolase n=1 Tax=Nonomuraea longispora TaxID=1848320 RepID=A0A4V2XJW6_9ACTN|nr:epoxide hydrolase family protein [Nonomuraea longispora]TDC04236.1 epoxide hydrolase [Nonomuraea longispora]